MAWLEGFQASYAGNDLNFADNPLCYYRNDSGVVQQVISISVPMGTGNGTFFAGDTVTGNGSPITAYLYPNNLPGFSSNRVTVSNVVNPSSDGGGYPNYDQMQTYTFTFSNPVIVQPGDTMPFTMSFIQDMNDSQVITWYRRRLTGVVQNYVSSYTVTFNLAGGYRTGGGELTQTVSRGGSATPPTCARTGYNFTGWDGSYTNVTSNRTITAQWKIITYTVSYNANGGSGAPGSQTKTYGVNLTLSSTRPYREGYNFLGWATSKSGAVAYQPGGTYTNNASVTLYAQWQRITYTVSYNANGGSGAPSSQTKTWGVNLVLSSTRPTRTGYNFLGWATSVNGAVAYQPGSTYTANASVTLYAQWSRITYTVSYNANGGSGAPSSQTKTWGVNLTLSSTVPTRAGHTFLGWATSSGGSVVYQPGDTYTNNASVTLYAKWQIITYTVSYNANGGTGAPASQIKTWGQTLVLSSTRPTRSVTLTFNANGGTVSPTSKSVNTPFGSWNTSANGSGTSYQPGGNYTTNAAATLYAQWNAGQVGSLPTPSRTNCIFVGWYTAINGGTQVTSTTTILNSTTIYARYDYIIQYNTNSLSEPLHIAQQIKHHQQNITLSNVRLSEPGKSFLGWSTSSTATTAMYAPGATYTSDAPVILYPVFVPGTYTVTFDLVGGTYQGGGALVQQVSGGGSAVLPNDPIKLGKKFRGWLGRYQNVLADSVVKACWDESPIWIFTGTEWIKFF